MHGYRAANRIGRGALLALLVLGVAACGDDDSGSARSSTPAGSSPPPTTEPPPNLPPPATRAATLEWQAPDTSTDGATLTDLAGYKIYYGTDVAQMTQTITIDNPGVLSYVVEDLAPATYYFAVTALNSKGYESERSNAGRKEIT
jgi:Fibronectin type III domain